MNCLFFSPVRREWGRAETWMARLSAGLRERGDAVAVLADPGSGWPAACRQDGVRFLACPAGPRLSPGTWIRLRRVFALERPDAVIVRGFDAARLARAAAPSVALLLKLPDPADLNETLADRLTFRYGVDRVLVDSHAVRDHYRRFPWVPPGKIVSVHTGIPVRGGAPDPARRARARERLGLAPGTLAVGVAANLVARSRVMDALEAFARSGPPAGAVLCLLGEGPMRAELRRRAGRLGLGGRVLLPGWLEEAPDLMWGWDLYLHTSVEEGLPRAMLEAMSCGVCCLAGRAGGAVEILRDGEDGALEPPGDLERMAARLRELAADPRARERIGAAAAARVRAEFTVAAMVGRAHAALADTIEHRRMLGMAPHPVPGEEGWRWIRTPGIGEDSGLPLQVRSFLEPAPRFPVPALRRPRALRLFRRARRLALLDTLSAPHLAAGWRPAGRGRRESILLVSRPPRSVSAAEWMASAGPGPQRRDFLRKLAIWLGRRHGAGIIPHGLRAENLLVREEAGDWSFALSDLDRCVLRWKPSLRETARQMDEFLRSFQPHAGRAELFRFAAEYRRTRHLHRAPMRRLLARLDGAAGPERNPSPSRAG